MKTKTIETEIQVLGYDELTEADRELVEAAKEMALESYAPYSKFHVGAAIRMADGSIERGSNQENVAFPSGICAERTAAWHASAVKPGMRMCKIAIAAATDGIFQPTPISPCGACRQALVEYETLHGPMEVILYGSKEIYRLPSMASLLPLTFTEF